MFNQRKRPAASRVGAGRRTGTRNGDTRSEMLALIAAGKGGMTLSDLGTLLGVSTSTAGYHIETLRDKGLARTLSTGFVILTDRGADAFELQEGAA